jgi:transcriptional regulator with XRE-family HTH domain
MILINAQQIRAARGLLDWSQEVLAGRAGISKDSVKNIEKSITNPQPATLEKIKQAFELSGVEFTATGLEQKDESVTVIDGADWYLRLLDDVHASLHDKKNAELLIMCADDRKSPEEVNALYRKIRNAGIKMRQLVEDGNTYLMGPVSEYRYMPKDKFINYVSLIYGDKVAICTDQNTKAIVFKDTILAMTWSNLFDVLWGLLEEPMKSDAQESF